MYPFLARLLSDPYNIDARALTGLEMLAVRMFAGESITPASVLAAVGMKAADPKAHVMDNSGADPGYVRMGSVGLVPVWGLLDRTDADVEGVGTSYESIKRGLIAAKADDQVSCRLMVVNSPGGAARPMAEYADSIYEDAMASLDVAGGGKPIYALVPDLCASAALGLAVQASAVYGLPGNWSGSIGTRISTVNWTERLKQMGITVETYTTGKWKDLGNPFRPTTDDDRAKMKAGLQEYFQPFKAVVGRGRKMAAEKVNELATGEGFVGPKVVEVGLMDAIYPSFQAVVAMLNQKHPARKPGGGVAVGMRANVEADATPGNAVAAIDSAAEESRMSTSSVLAAAGAVAAAAIDKPAVVTGLTIDQVTEAASKAGAQGAANERKRVNGIMHLAGKYPNNAKVTKLRDDALASDTPISLDEFKAKVMDAVMDGDPPVGGSFSVGASGWQREVAGIEASLLARCNPNLEQTMLAGGELAERTISGFAETARLSISGNPNSAAWTKPAEFTAALRTARSEGYTRRSILTLAERCAVMAMMSMGAGQAAAFPTHDAVLAAAFGHSASDFPKILSNLANKTLLSYFEEQETTYQFWCQIGSSTDFKSADLITASEGQDLDELPDGQRPTEATVNERAESITLKTFAKSFSLGRKMLINDDLGAFTQKMQSWGVVAARKPEQRAWTKFLANRAMADGNNFFSTAHKNLAGSGSALSPAAVEAAMSAMMLQKGFGASAAPLNIVPKLLLVPTPKWGEAERICGAKVDPTSSNANSGRPNVVGGKLTPISSTYLYDNSPIAWYLLGDPRTNPAVIVRFLNGNRRPIINQITNGSILGVEQEIVHDCEAEVVNYEAAFKDPGA